MSTDKNPYANPDGSPIEGKEFKWLDWERVHEENPYANPDGSMIDGKESEFIEWSKNEDVKRLKQLPPAKREEVINSQKKLQDRMQS
jgi:hypothetical protein